MALGQAARLVLEMQRWIQTCPCPKAALLSWKDEWETATPETPTLTLWRREATAPRKEDGGGDSPGRSPRLPRGGGLSGPSRTQRGRTGAWGRRQHDLLSRQWTVCSAGLLVREGIAGMSEAERWDCVEKALECHGKAFGLVLKAHFPSTT